MRRSNSITLAIAAAVLCSIGVSCKKEYPAEPQPPGHSTIVLQATFTSIRWCRLQWSNDSTASSHKYLLLRDGRDTVFNDTVPSNMAVEVLQDTTLKPGTSYSYWVYRIVNGQRWDSASVTVVTKDTSRDQYAWTMTRIGKPDSYLYSVWASSERSIWMCGNIATDTGTIRILHYTGDSLIPIPWHNGLLAFSTTYSCFGTADTNVWFTAPATLARWDGNRICIYPLNGSVDSVPNLTSEIMTSIWVAPGGVELFAGGQRGVIIHRRANGTWEKQESGTKVTIMSIIGFAPNDVYACGREAEGIILHYDGTAWTQVAIGTDPPVDSTYLFGTFMSLAGDSPDSLYVVGDLIYCRRNGKWQLAKAPWNTPQDYTFGAYKEWAFGTWNNMWIVGDFGYMMHFNGEKWKTNYPFWNTSGSQVFVGGRTLPNQVFVVGSDNQSAFFIRGR